MAETATLAASAVTGGSMDECDECDECGHAEFHHRPECLFVRLTSQCGCRNYVPKKLR